MNHSAATRIDEQTQQRANQVLHRTRAKMSDLLRIGLLRVIEEFEARGSISSGDGVAKAPARARGRAGARKAQTSKNKRQTSTTEPPPG